MADYAPPPYTSPFYSKTAFSCSTGHLSTIPSTSDIDDSEHSEDLSPRTLYAHSFDRPGSARSLPSGKFRKNMKEMTGFGTTEEDFDALPIAIQRKVRLFPNIVKASAEGFPAARFLSKNLVGGVSHDAYAMSCSKAWELPVCTCEDCQSGRTSCVCPCSRQLSPIDWDTSSVDSMGIPPYVTAVVPFCATPRIVHIVDEFEYELPVWGSPQMRIRWF